MDVNLKHQIAEELEVNANDLDRETVLRELEYWDSVMALTVMTIIDTFVGEPVPPEEFSEAATFGDLEDLVASMVGSLDPSNQSKPE